MFLQDHVPYLSYFKECDSQHLDPSKFRTEQVSDVALDDIWSRRRTKTLGVSGIHLKQMNDKLLSRKNRECSSVAQSGVEILAHRSVSPFPIWFAARVKSFDLTKAFDHIRPSFAFTNLCYGNGSGLQVTHTTGRPN